MLLQFIFYPRKDSTPCPSNSFDLSVPVGEGVSISCRFLVGYHEWPWILFFHGNGEVVSDYDEISPFYHQNKINLVVADYRGYGASTGVPTLTDLVQDAHFIFKGVKEELTRRNLRKDLWVMGRSLGSISALELAYHHQGEMKGVIIESGFPSVVRIMFHLGVPALGMGLEKIDQQWMEDQEDIPSHFDHPWRTRQPRSSSKCERHLSVSWVTGQKTPRHPFRHPQRHHARRIQGLFQSHSRIC
ncbi:MAG: alpha/beta hydrolase [Thermodesulfobacteriota bacterium]